MMEAAAQMTVQDEHAVARARDQSEFAALVEPHRRELQVHCYRMLGSFEDAEDLVQETLLRAWRKRDTYAGRAPLRAWLYRIATNACLDALDRPRRPPADGGEPPWLQPYPDRLLDEIPAPAGEQPDAAVVARETIELAFLVAIQRLPPRQRAVLILRDVLSWSAKETAALLDTSVASANSALQRARTALREVPEPADPTDEERAIVERYVEATERVDIAALAEMLREDARSSMPPHPEVYSGRDTIVSAWVTGGFGNEEYRDFRCLTTRANRQPAVACYLRRPGEDAYLPLALDVLRIAGGRITEIVTFPGSVFEAFALPPRL